MFSLMIETEQVHLQETDYLVRYFKRINFDGIVRYSLEVRFGPDDALVIDDPSYGRLRHKLQAILPAALYSRRLAGMAPPLRSFRRQPATQGRSR
ncbi:MAG: hypothetical protein AB1515_08995 [Nitrospirota bacterium]